MLGFGPSQAVRRYGPEGRHDPWLLLAIAGLVTFGIVMVASSSIAVADGQHIGEFHYLKRHATFLLAGGAIAWFVAARVELDWLERYSGRMMLITFGLLLLVFVPHLGMRINGARRWINLGISGFQPVELAKLTVVLYVASYLVRHRDAVETKFLGAVKPVAVAGLTAVLLLAQPDFGSAALIGVVTIGMLWLGGARMRNLVIMGLPMLPLGAWLALSTDYRVKRLTSFLDPWKDPFDNGFQLTQALIAVGRGFQVGLRAVERGQRFAGYCAFGVSLTIALQALVSIGVNLGVLPTKGLTLPLISSGGSSVMMTCAAIGLLIRVSYEVARAENAALQAVPERVVAEVRR
jgi:cell division protein FtsW